MKTKLYLSVFAIGIIAISSCRKFDGGSIRSSNLGHGGGPDTDVYVAGYVYASDNIRTVPTYWKNGVIHKLADSADGAAAESVAVHDTNVLIAVTSEYPNAVNMTAVCYLNGNRIELDEKAFVGQTHCAAFSGCGCDFYVCGAKMVSGMYKACYWKNGGPAHFLPGTSHQSIASGIVVHDGDVYVAGSALTSVKNQYAVYWKNDTVHNLTDTLLRDAQGLDVALLGNDVYVTGYVIASDGNSNVPTYWINGTAHTVSKPGGLFSVATGGGNFYFGGGADDFGFANYWINAVSYNLTVPTGDIQPRSLGVGVLGSDVYVAGGFDNPADKLIPNYWKNGNFVALPTPNQGLAKSIAAVAH